MIRFLSGTALATVILAGPALSETYHLDPGHTEVRFYYSHAGLSEQSGEWTVIDGTVDFDAEDIAATEVNITLDAASIDTGVDALDSHLMSGDFFDVSAHPTITFTSTSVSQSGDENVTVVGDLTIKGVTTEITLEFGLNHIGEHPLSGFGAFFEGEWLGVSGSGTVTPTELGLPFGAAVISDSVRLEINTEMRAGGWE